MTLPRLTQGHPPLAEVVKAQDRLIAHAYHEAPPEVAADIELLVRELGYIRLQALTLESVLHGMIKKVEVHK
jgi:hypothetical protein